MGYIQRGTYRGVHTERYIQRGTYREVHTERYIQRGERVIKEIKIATLGETDKRKKERQCLAKAENEANGRM